VDLGRQWPFSNSTALSQAQNDHEDRVETAEPELALRIGHRAGARATLADMSVMRFSLLAVLICGTIGVLKLQPRPDAEAATLELSAHDRTRGLTFDPDVAPQDREWILAAVAKARPEASRLIDEIDGLVTVKTFSDPDTWALGWAQVKGPGRYELRLNVSRLNGPRQVDREMVTLHELGHVVDFAILDDAVRDRLAAQVPKTGVCHARLADCALPEERFADTFAKWALRGAVSITGAGYSLPAPASLEDWGAPLSALAIQLDVTARS
jgi:hypothetical protein